MSAYDSRPDTYEHINLVRKYLRRVTMRLILRADKHDASKLVEPEVSVFDEFTPKLKDSTYGSDEYKQFLEGMGKGLQHHYAHNDHHPEHFYDPDPVASYSAGEPTSRWSRAPLTGIHAMDLIQLTEMICDWLAATKRHDDGDIRRSIEQNRERFGYGDEIAQLLVNTVEVLDREPKTVPWLPDSPGIEKEES